MIQVIDVKSSRALSEYKSYAYLSGMVKDLDLSASVVAKKLQGRTVWMINSTPNGGGVAEMMPKMVIILRELGINTKWVVFSPENESFFRLTKKIHNLIHNSGTVEFNEDKKALYESISYAAADKLEKLITAKDILVVHDPQPLGAGAELTRRIGLKSIWRCHIGLDKHTSKTDSAWEFIKAYTDGYDHAVFSSPEYLPSFLKEKSSIITPSIDPLSHKNRDISNPELISILYKAGIIKNGNHHHLSPLWRYKALRLNTDGEFVESDNNCGNQLLFNPTITQISRWDYLKGWEFLIEGFILLKRKYRHNGSKKSTKDKRISATRLILAGPEPSSVQDDPEGKGVLNGLCNYYTKLPVDDQKDICILSLPMGSREKNQLIVNALQRCSTLVAQNSIQEGFGLTATEAMWKKVPVLGTSACGLRLQIQDGKDGRLTMNPTNPKEIAENLTQMLTKPKLLEKWGRSGQKRVYQEFLVFNQIKKWLNCIGQVVN